MERYMKSTSNVKNPPLTLINPDDIPEPEDALIEPDEEEEDIFPVAEDVFSHEKAEQLGQRFEKREKAELSLVAEKSESKLVD